MRGLPTDDEHVTTQDSEKNSSEGWRREVKSTYILGINSYYQEKLYSSDTQVNTGVMELNISQPSETRKVDFWPASKNLSHRPFV